MSLRSYIKDRFRQLKDSHRLVRVSVGIVLVLGGLFGALPVLGFWMLPLGLILLSVDFPWAKRLLAYLRLMWRRLRTRLSRPPIS